MLHGPYLGAVVTASGGEAGAVRMNVDRVDDARLAFFSEVAHAERLVQDHFAHRWAACGSSPPATVRLFSVWVLGFQKLKNWKDDNFGVKMFFRLPRISKGLQERLTQPLRVVAQVDEQLLLSPAMLRPPVLPMHVMILRSSHRLVMADPR